MTEDESAETHELLTLQEAAGHLRIGIRTAYRLAAEGELPAVKVGASWRIARSELDMYLSADSPRRTTKGAA